MRDAECVPENNICVVDGCIFVGNPFGDTTGWFTRGLRNVTAGRVYLLVIIWEVLAWAKGDKEGTHIW
jgi:hypothetical protein